MKYILRIFFALFIVSAISACARQPTPEPERCSICDYIPSHAPCLVNLNTGEVGEIFCYDPHPEKVGEIADYQRGGYFCFMSVAGLQGYLDACVPEAHVYVPRDTGEYDEQYFCNSCRQLLLGYENDGYVLADLREPEIPVLYPVVVGERFSFRCYEVSVSMKEDKEELDITVVGTIKPSNDGAEVAADSE